MKSQLLSLVSNVQHAFGESDNPRLDEVLGANWLDVKPHLKQVHGISFCEVHSPRQECGEVDALFTSHRNQPLSILTADCVPILLAKRDGSRVAALHAGWRGTLSRIVEVLWTEFTLRGELSQNWVGAIGPAIGPCCYQVSEDLAKKFGNRHGHRMLDLPALNSEQLTKLGIENEVLRFCTRCARKTPESPEFRFFSHRRDADGRRQNSAIKILPS